MTTQGLPGYSWNESHAIVVSTVYRLSGLIFSSHLANEYEYGLNARVIPGYQIREITEKSTSNGYDVENRDERKRDEETMGMDGGREMVEGERRKKMKGGFGRQRETLTRWGYLNGHVILT